MARKARYSPAHRAAPPCARGRARARAQILTPAAAAAAASSAGKLGLAEEEDDEEEDATPPAPAAEEEEAESGASDASDAASARSSEALISMAPPPAVAAAMAPPLLRAAAAHDLRALPEAGATPEGGEGRSSSICLLRVRLLGSLRLRSPPQPAERGIFECGLSGAGVRLLETSHKLQLALSAHSSPRSESP